MLTKAHLQGERNFQLPLLTFSKCLVVSVLRNDANHSLEVQKKDQQNNENNVVLVSIPVGVETSKFFVALIVVYLCTTIY